jgi:hypothetical protein
MRRRRRHSLPQVHRTLHRTSPERDTRHHSSREGLNWLIIGVVSLVALTGLIVLILIGHGHSPTVNGFAPFLVPAH